VTSSPQVELVLAWHAALNASDLDRLLALSATDVEVGGPRGSGRGSDLLRDWAVRAGVRMEPGRVVDGDGVVVVEQSALWKSADGALTEPQTIATLFRVLDGRVSSVIRYDDLASALQAAGLKSA